MLIEFTVENFRSFKDEQKFSMVANSDKDTLCDNYFSHGKLNLLKSVAIYGPNASGKSNLIKAIETMKEIVLGSDVGESGQAFKNIVPFRLDRSFASEPSKFEVMFIQGKVRYQYGFTATTERIYDEWLVAYPKGYRQEWFSRSFDTKTGNTAFQFSQSYFKGEKKVIERSTGSNRLYLSVGSQLNNPQLEAVYQWFNNTLIPVTTDANIKRGYTATTLFDRKNDGLYKNRILRLLAEVDPGITDVTVTGFDADQALAEYPLPDEMPPDDRKKILKELRDKKLLRVETIHKSAHGKDIRFDLNFESEGTRRFFELLGPWFDTVDNGRVVFFDELETSLHPKLASFIIQFIHASQSGAQLIFTTHNTSLMNPELLRRDQIWFTEKNKTGSSELYPLTDFGPRRDEAFEKRYLSGRYGALPIINAFDLYES